MSAMENATVRRDSTTMQHRRQGSDEVYSVLDVAVVGGQLAAGRRAATVTTTSAQFVADG